MVKLLNFSHLSSLGWFCNMYVVDVNAVSSKVCPQQRRSLLSTRALITGQVLWKVHVLLRGCECFAFFGSFLLSFDFSYRCWSSPAKTKWKFWKLCDSAGVKWRLNACMHVTTTTHFRGWFTNGTLSTQLNSLKAQFFCSLFSTLLIEEACSQWAQFQSSKHAWLHGFFLERFQVFWTDPVALGSFRSRSRYISSVFSY